MREINTQTFRLDDFSSGIVSNVTTSDRATTGADDILNWIPGRQGELIKVPIGNFLFRMNDTIARVVPFQSKAATFHFVSLDDGTFHRYYQDSATPIGFPSEIPMIGNATAGYNRWIASTVYAVGYSIMEDNFIYQVTAVTGTATSGATEPVWDTATNNTTIDNEVTWTGRGPTQPTKVYDHFTYANKLHLLTGRKVNYVYEPGTGIVLWGQSGILPPPAIATSGRWAVGIYTIGDVIVEDHFVHQVTAVTGTGASGTTEPVWNTVTDGTTTDLEVTWTCRGPAVKEDTVYSLQYRYTHWDGRCESNPSPENGTPVDAENGVAQVNVWTGYPCVEQIRIYRWEPDAGAWRFVQALDKSTLSILDNTTYQWADIIYSNTLGESLMDDNNPPPACKTGMIYKNHAFLTSDKYYPSRLYFSKMGNPFSFPLTNWLNIGGDDGDRIMAIAPLSDSLLVFKRNSLWAVIGEDSATWQVRYIAATGTVARKSVVRTRDSVYFMSYDGIYTTDGISIKKASYAIDDKFVTETEATLKDTTALYVPLKNSLYFNIYKSYAANNGVTWVFNLDTGSWSRTTMGVTDGAVINGWTYFALGTDYYVVTDSPYKTVQSELVTKLLPLTDPVDYVRIRRVSISAGNGEAATALNVYYRNSEDDDWTFLKTLTFSSSNQTFRFSTNITGNYFQFKVTHTGKMDRFNGLILEYRTMRNRKLMAT